MGFDKPKSLGESEFGGTLALPIWMNYMRVALNKQKVENRTDSFDSGNNLSSGGGNTGDGGGHTNKAPEELKVDSNAVPPANSEARQAAEKVNEADVKEAAKPKAPAGPDPLAPFVYKPPVTQPSKP